jgi:hypothetical protein
MTDNSPVIVPTEMADQEIRGGRHQVYLVWHKSLAPIVIATDLRLYRMGQAVGTAVTRAALSCIFSELASLDFMPDQIHLMSAATDLLAHPVEPEIRCNNDGRER